MSTTRLASALVGIAIDDDVFTLTDHITDYIPELKELTPSSQLQEPLPNAWAPRDSNPARRIKRTQALSAVLARDFAGQA